MTGSHKRDGKSYPYPCKASWCGIQECRGVFELIKAGCLTGQTEKGLKAKGTRHGHYLLYWPFCTWKKSFLVSFRPCLSFSCQLGKIVCEFLLTSIKRLKSAKRCLSHIRLRRVVSYFSRESTHENDGGICMILLFRSLLVAQRKEGQSLTKH